MIYEWAKNRTSLGETSFSNQIDGPEPNFIKLRTINQILKYINNIIDNLANKDKVPLSFINIIVDDNIFNDISSLDFAFEITHNYEKDSNKIGIFKTSAYKGLESNIILYVHKSNNEYNYKYVGLTRARFYLYDIELLEE